MRRFEHHHHAQHILVIHAAIQKALVDAKSKIRIHLQQTRDLGAKRL
jgi:hypothetical protein